MTERWGSIYSERHSRPEITGGRYHVVIDHRTYGQGDFGQEQIIRLDDGPCDNQSCRMEHLVVGDADPG